MARAIAACISPTCCSTKACPRVIIDPDPGQSRAIRAYEKAGFKAFDERTSIYGPALMMARDAEADSLRREACSKSTANVLLSADPVIRIVEGHVT